MGISKQRMDSKAYDFGGRLSESPVLTLTHQQHQQHLHANYLRNSKAIGVLWGVFTICFAIIDVVVFLQPHWLGDTQHSKGTGHFGLWQFCRLVQDGQEVVCEGRLDSFQSIPSPAFRAATVFVGLSVVAVLLCIGCMLLFFVIHSSTVFHVCGWLQVFCALCLVVGVLAFPAGWGAREVRDVCGPEADSYEPAQCGIRWAYILAIIGVCDCATLAALAFVLGTRYVKLLPDHYITNSGEVNTAFLNDTQSIASRKSVQPVLLMPAPPAPGLHHPGHPHHHMGQVDPERFSEYSHRTGRSGSRVDNYGNPPSIHRNFQL